MWWIRQSGRIEGPFSDDEVRRRMRLNLVRSLDRVSEDGVTWLYLKDSDLWRKKVPGESSQRGTAGAKPSARRPVEEVVSQAEIEPEAAEHAPPKAEIPIPERFRLPEKHEDGKPWFMHARYVVAAFAAAMVMLVAASFVFFMIGRSMPSGNGKNVPQIAALEQNAETSDRPPDSQSETNAKDKVAARPPIEKAPVPEPDSTAKPVSLPQPVFAAPVEYKDIKDKIAIITCDDGSGTGFLLDMGGKTYLVSNEHVVRAASMIKATLPSGEVLSLGEFSVATDRDLSRFEVVGCSIKPFVATEEDPNCGDMVSVCGNSLGGGVVTESKGFIQGVGPARLETNAEIVPGNSGSPLVAKNGLVLGVATLIDRRGMQSWTSKDTRYDNTPRRFATRLKNVKWEVADRRRYESQTGDFEEFKLFWDNLRLYIQDNFANDSEAQFTDYKRRFFKRGLGFDDVLTDLSDAYEKRSETVDKLKRRWENRSSFIQRLIDRGVSKAEGEKEIRDYDRKTDDTYDRTKSAFRDFSAKKERALGKARRFLTGRSWVAPQFVSGSGCDDQDECVNFYLSLIDEAEARVKQDWSNFEKTFKKIERNDDEY